MKIKQCVDDTEISEWYSNKYNVDLDKAEKIILDWMGIFDNGNQYSYLFKKEKDEWVKDLFEDFPKLEDGVVIIYNN